MSGSDETAIWVREACLDDFPKLLPVFEEGDRFHREALPWMFQNARGAFPTEEYIAGLISREDVGLLVAEHEDELIGSVTVRLLQSPEFPLLVPRRYASVDTLVVVPEWRKRGVASRMMEACEEWARRQGATYIELVVYEFNEGAKALYRGLGYETLSRRLSKPL